MELGELGEWSRLLPDLLQWRERGGQTDDEIGGGLELPLAQIGARVGPVQLGALTALEPAQLLPQRRERVRQSIGPGLWARPPQDRPLQCCNGAQIARQPGAGMLEQGKQVDRRKRAECGLCGKPRERPGRGVGEGIAAGVVDRNGPACQCGEHAAGERAVGGDQRCGLVRRLQRFTQCNRNCERFFLGICSFDDRQCRERRGRRNIGAGELPPEIGGRRRPHGFGDIALSPMSGSLAEHADLVAVDADAAQQRLHRELRMPDRGRDELLAAAIPPAGDQLPGIRIEIDIESRQHHGAVRQPRNGCDQSGGCRHRAGRAGGDHRTIGVGGKPRRFCLDQRVAPARSLDGAALGENLRPGLARDLQEFERELPVAVESVGHQLIEAVPGHAAGDHVVDQARKMIGERERRGRVAGDERCLACLVRCDAQGPCRARAASAAFAARARPVRAEGRARRRPGRRTPSARTRSRPRRRRRWRRCAAGSQRCFRSHRGTDRAPHGRRAGSEGRASRGRARADHRRPGKPGTSFPSIKARISTGTKGAEAGMVKTRAGSMPDHTPRRAAAPCNYAALATMAASAALTASGVPTCIQTPSSRSPQSRSASAARSNNGDIEDGPAGTPAKKACVRMAAPA